MSLPTDPSKRWEFIRQMLDCLETPSKRLTQWEEEFIASVTDQFDRKGNLSDRQIEILEGIYTEKTP